MKFFVALTGALVMNAAANLLMKLGAKSTAASGGFGKDGFISAVGVIASNSALVIGLAFFVLNVFLYLYALQSPRLPISIAYPIMVGGGYVLIAVIARLHPSLQERLTGGQWLGVALVMLGIGMIALKADALE